MAIGAALTAIGSLWSVAPVAAGDSYCGSALDSVGAEAVALARISGGGRIHFVLGSQDRIAACPSSAVDCRAKSFLINGDVVLAGVSQNGFRCVTYRSPAGVESSGFMPDSALVLVALAAPSLANWIGSWRRDKEAYLMLKLAKGAKSIDIHGEATYGASDPERVKRGAVNLGDLASTATPRGDVLAVGEGYDGTGAPDPNDLGDCQARLRLLGRYLVVEDNLACGGANVTFGGIYGRNR
jgi:hypothetical protein